MQTTNISTFFQYRQALRDLIARNGSEMLSDAEMERFIKQYDLNSRFGITLYDVRKDVREIVEGIPAFDQGSYQRALRSELLPKAKEGLSDVEIDRFLQSHGYQLGYGLSVKDVRYHLAQIADGTWVPMPRTHTDAFQNFSDYQQALRKRLPPSSKEPLTDISIKVFIKRNGFDKKYGLDVATVRQDMYALPNSYQMLYLSTAVDSTSPKTTETAQQSKPPEPIVMPKPKPEDLIDDRTFYDLVSKAFLDYTEIVKDRKRLSGLLRDLCPDRRREINVLLQIYDLGIIEEISRQTEISHLFVHRICKTQIEEYGTNESLAKSMVQIWCLCYGRNILHIKCDEL